MNEVSIQILYDNCKANQKLQEGWGFSALIETKERKILFDTGNDVAAFFSNAREMGVNCSSMTDVVFSHKHRDHTAGCKEVLHQLQSGTPVYLPQGFPMREIPSHLRAQTVTGLAQLGKSIFVLALKGGLFLQEQALLLQTEKGLVVITGCAHPGIVKILETAKEQLKSPIYFVLGGFHLFRARKSCVDEVVTQFQSLGVKQVAPCHCSGAFAIGQFQKAYQNQFHKIGTGSVVTI